MSLKELAEDYRRSAMLIQQRMQALKQQSRQEKNKSDAEDRLVLLRAEYYHLLRMAEYLFSYYDGCEQEECA